MKPYCGDETRPTVPGIVEIGIAYTHQNIPDVEGYESEMNAPYAAEVAYQDEVGRPRARKHDRRAGARRTQPGAAPTAKRQIRSGTLLSSRGLVPTRRRSNDSRCLCHA